MALRDLFTSGRLAAKAIRFAGIGVLSGTIYAVVTASLVTGFGIAPVPASIAGYCASVPASFIGHRQFSFRSRGHIPLEVLRFVLAQAINILVTAGSMHAATALFGAHYALGMVAAVILVPIANFVFMNLWVFRDQEGSVRTMP